MGTEGTLDDLDDSEMNQIERIAGFAEAYERRRAEPSRNAPFSNRKRVDHQTGKRQKRGRKPLRLRQKRRASQSDEKCGNCRKLDHRGIRSQTRDRIAA